MEVATFTIIFLVFTIFLVIAATKVLHSLFEDNPAEIPSDLMEEEKPPQPILWPFEEEVDDYGTMGFGPTYFSGNAKKLYLPAKRVTRLPNGSYAVETLEGRRLTKSRRRVYLASCA